MSKYEKIDGVDYRLGKYCGVRRKAKNGGEYGTTRISAADKKKLVAALGHTCQKRTSKKKTKKSKKSKKPNYSKKKTSYKKKKKKKSSSKKKKSSKKKTSSKKNKSSSSKKKVLSLKGPSKKKSSPSKKKSLPSKKKKKSSSNKKVLQLKGPSKKKKGGKPVITSIRADQMYWTKAPAYAGKKPYSGFGGDNDYVWDAYNNDWGLQSNYKIPVNKGQQPFRTYEGRFFTKSGRYESPGRVHPTDILDLNNKLWTMRTPAKEKHLTQGAPPKLKLTHWQKYKK